jgi:hypothetical protein
MYVWVFPLIIFVVVVIVIVIVARAVVASHSLDLSPCVVATVTTLQRKQSETFCVSKELE